MFAIQKATVGKGINLIFLGEGFVDKDMTSGGKYETMMKQAADKMFELEPYKSFRNRFNLYGVKVVSPTAEFTEGAAKRINEDYETQRQVLRYLLYGRNNTSASIGECKRVCRRRNGNAPLRIFQRILSESRLPYPFGNH